MTKKNLNYKTCVSALALASVLAFAVTVNAATPAKAKKDIAASACAGAIQRLQSFSQSDAKVREVLDAARVNMKTPPDIFGQTNRWLGATSVDDLVSRMVSFSLDWCEALPEIKGNSDNGLTYIGEMYWFFYQNDYGTKFAHGLDVNGQPLASGFNFLQEFARESGAFMDSAQSTATIPEWINNRRIEIEDYQRTQANQYVSWNDFFTRALKTETDGSIPSRPVTMPERDYVISAPTDCVMNPLVQKFMDGSEVRRRFIENPLQLDTVLDVKNIPMSVSRLLGNAPQDIKNKFAGGTGLSCILMPATYHHFHAPVSGTVVYADVISGPTFGYNDWANMMPSNHNPAQLGTDFSQFEVYQRGVVIIEVKYLPADPASTTLQTGYVASIPVGLDTIGSVKLEKEIVAGAKVTRVKSRIGHFEYGGSMNVMLFSAGLATGSIQTRLGNQIGIIDTSH